MTVRIVVPGEPVPKGRPRFSHKNGRVYTPRKTAAYEVAVGWQAVASGARFGGPVAVYLTFRCKPRADIDNLAKAVLDGLQKGLLFVNDAMVHELHAQFAPVVDGPCVEIEVAALVTAATNP